MSWTIAGKYVRAAATDPDAQAYLQAVEDADGQSLEFEVARAIDNFVLGCKADGIWNAIKASCILAGARTLAGALVPLAGTAPTNNNFVSGDYNRKTGLVGDGSTKYLDSNRNNNADPQDNKHLAVMVHTHATETSLYIGAGTGSDVGRSGITYFSGVVAFRLNNAASRPPRAAVIESLVAASRVSSENFTAFSGGSAQNVDVASETPRNENIGVFAVVTGTLHANARLAFYSIGESLDLALLNARVTDLVNAFDTAIPS